MAKALVNKGIPIKADNPKDPYIRDENGIKDIVDSSTVFGKTLGTADGKLQLKNGNNVLSEVSVPAPDLSVYGYDKGLIVTYDEGDNYFIGDIDLEDMRFRTGTAPYHLIKGPSRDGYLYFHTPFSS